MQDHPLRARSPSADSQREQRTNTKTTAKAISYPLEKTLQLPQPKAVIVNNYTSEHCMCPYPKQLVNLLPL